MATESGHAFLNQLVAKWTHELFEGFLFVFVARIYYSLLLLFLTDFLVINGLQILVHDVVSALEFSLLPDAFRGAVRMSLSQHFFVVQHLVHAFSRRDVIALASRSLADFFL